MPVTGIQIRSPATPSWGVARLLAVRGVPVTVTADVLTAVAGLAVVTPAPMNPHCCAHQSRPMLVSRFRDRPKSVRWPSRCWI